ncbi:hypothetical protein ACQKEG_07945, partial [Klebsiella quasipneumoniae]
MITHVSPLGSMDMLSQLEVDMLKPCLWRRWGCRWRWVPLSPA